MIRRTACFLALTALACLSVAAFPAAAEWFADLYAGAAFTQKTDTSVKVEFPPAGAGSSGTLEDLKLDRSAFFGGRIGYWLDAWPFVGFALDASHYRPDADNQDRDIRLGSALFSDQEVEFDFQLTGVSLDLMLRWPLLTSIAFPKGQLQPYLSVGPTLFFSRIKAKDTVDFTFTDRKDHDTTLGVKAAIGLAWQFYKNFALLFEYRFTHASPEFEIREVDLGKTTLGPDFNSHHLLGGISFRF